MPRFNIIEQNPFKYKSKILDFWREYLPGTPAGRLEWMENNPAGSAIWLFAIENNTGVLAGVISILPKDLFLGGKRLRAAILGDLMIQKKYRVFGPTLSLIKAAIALKDKREYDFLYTIPNLNAKKMIEKVGFKSLGKCYTMMCPQKVDFFIKKYVGSFGAKLLEPILLAMLKIFSKTTYVSSSGVFENINFDDEHLSLFFQKVRKSRVSKLTGDYNLLQIKWRYQNNPSSKFQCITYKKNTGGDIKGFFVFSLDNMRLQLYDLVALDNRILLKIIKKVCSIAKNANCRGVYFKIYEKNPMLAVLKKCGFFDTKDEAEIYLYPKKIKEVENWYFTSADRNI